MTLTCQCQILAYSWPELGATGLTPVPWAVTAGSPAPASALEWPHWGHTLLLKPLNHFLPNYILLCAWGWGTLPGFSGRRKWAVIKKTKKKENSHLGGRKPLHRGYHRPPCRDLTMLKMCCMPPIPAKTILLRIQRNIRMMSTLPGKRDR